MPLPPPPFYLNYLEYTEAPMASTSSPPPYDLPSLRLRDLKPKTSERLSYAVVSNFLVCRNFFLEELGSFLRTAENGGHCIFDDKAICQNLGSEWGYSVAKVPSFGTMHSKFIILFYNSFVRVAILSNNFLYKDWQRKTGTIFVQDFPRSKSAAATSSSSRDEFGVPLIKYFEQLQTRECNRDAMRHIISCLQEYSFASAKAAIVASVPGSHETLDYGHLRMRSLLQNVRVKGRILAQYSSQGSTTHDTINDFLLSFRGGKPKDPSSSSSSSSFSSSSLSLSFCPTPQGQSCGFLCRSTQLLSLQERLIHQEC